MYDEGPGMEEACDKAWTAERKDGFCLMSFGRFSGGGGGAGVAAHGQCLVRAAWPLGNAS